ALHSNRCRWAVTGDHECVVIERQKFFVNRGKNVWRRSSPEIGPANTVLKERVSRKHNVSPVFEQETRTARSVSRRVNHAELNAIAGDRAAVIQETIDRAAFWSRQTQPLGLCIQRIEQEQIGLVNRCGRTGSLLKLEDRSHMVDMCMCAHNLLQCEA